LNVRLDSAIAGVPGSKGNAALKGQPTRVGLGKPKELAQHSGGEKRSTSGERENIEKTDRSPGEQERHRRILASSGREEQLVKETIFRKPGGRELRVNKRA